MQNDVIINEFRYIILKQHLDMRI